MTKQNKMLLGVGAIAIASYLVWKNKKKSQPTPTPTSTTTTPINEADMEYGGQSSTLGEVGSRCIAAFEPFYIEGNVYIKNGKKTCIATNWQTK